MKMVRMLLAALAVALVLTACGGGGGGGSGDTGSGDTGGGGDSGPVQTPVATPPPVTEVISVSVADGAVVSSDTFQGISFALSDGIDLSTLTESNIALWAGSAGVPGNAVRVEIIPSDKGFLIAPVAKLGYGQVYVVTVVKDSILDTLGRPIQVDGFSFTTTAQVCTGLTVWSDDYGTCVVPLGVELVGVNQMQDPVCTADQWVWTSACFTNAVRNGTVKIAESATLADGKPLIAALFADPAGANAILAFEVSDPKSPVRVGGNLLSDFADVLINRATPNPKFLLANLTVSSMAGNYQFSWDAVAKTFVYVKL